MPHTQLQTGFSIAIDGPVASGKGTVAHLLAEKLNGFDLYTGAMYRSVALYCIENNVDINNEAMVVSVLNNVEIDLDGQGVILNGKNVIERIQDADVTHGSSIVGVYKKVRQELVRRQQEMAKRELGRNRIVIAEGRDIAFRVLPHAELKVFITADPFTRATRRKVQEDLKEDIQSILEDIKKRDLRDSQREVDPLVKDPEEHGYFVVDTTHQTKEQTLEAILQELRKRGLTQ